MTSIPEFYAGRTIFVTGGTGFMGKVLLEKMVRCIPDVTRIYLLLREKKGLSPEERIEVMTSKMPFTFNDIDPSNFKKLVAIHGDITQENLGLSEEDRQILVEEVSVVFHLAASIRMDSSMKTAVMQNTVGTQKILNLCTEMKNLVSVLHLSTAYCNVDIEYMEEKVYPIKFDPYTIINMVKWMDEESLEKIQESIMEPHPNSYTFSKRLAEIVAWDMGKKLPITIARPSIVVPSLNEPTPGWVDTINGPVGIFAAAGKGVMRCMLADANMCPQVAPVDLAINSLIIAACIRVTEKFPETPIYNLTQGDVVQMSWQEVIEKCRVLAFRHPFSQMLWYPGANLTTNAFLHKLMVFFLHMIPAYTVDFLMILFFQKPFLVNIHGRLNIGLRLLSYFALRKFEFANENTLKLDSYLNLEDLETFGVNTAEIDVDGFIENAFFGTKKFCFNENMQRNVYLCKIQMYFFYLLDRICKILFVYGLMWMVLYAFGATYLLSWKHWFGTDALNNI